MNGWNSIKMSEESAMMRDEHIKEEALRFQLADKLGLFKSNDVFDVAKKLSKNGFEFRLEYPANMIYVVGDINDVKEIANNVDGSVYFEQFSENVVKIQF